MIISYTDLATNKLEKHFKNLPLFIPVTKTVEKHALGKFTVNICKLL